MGASHICKKTFAGSSYMAIFDKASTAAARTKAFSKINPEDLACLVKAELLVFVVNPL